MVFDFRLRVFYTVSQKLSFTKAATELFITQPAVTKHIHELEQQLGVRLFKRHGNSISITAAGEVLVRYAEKVFSSYATLEAELAQFGQVAGGTLRIGASTTLAQTILPKLLALFKRAYPNVSFSFVQGNTTQITQQVIAEKLDMGLVEGSAHFPQISYSPFAKDELVLVAKATSKVAKKAEISPKHLLDIPLVLREEGSGTLDVIYKALHAVHINPKDLKVETRLESSVSIKQYLLYAEAAAFLSIQSVTKELQYNELSVIDIKGFEIFRTFHFIQLHGQQSPLTQLFRRFCLSHYNLK